MPIIIDANRAGDFSCDSGHAGEILVRLSRKRMRIALGGKLTKELIRTRLRDLLAELNRSGLLCVHKEIDVQEVEKELLGSKICSNDSHILALAIVSKCRLLYSADQELIKDFKDVRIVNPKGKVVTPATTRAVAAKLFDRFGI